MSNDVEGLQQQVENISNRFDTALHKLADYQRVVAGAVKGGVYENDNYWWHELCRLANEQAVEQLRALDFAICAPEYHALLDEQGDRFCRMCGQPLSQ